MRWKDVGAVLKEFTISYERKVSDGDYGSVGGQFFITCEVGSKAKQEEVMEKAYEWLKEQATRNLKPSMELARAKLSTAPEQSSLPEEPPMPFADPEYCSIHGCKMKKYSKGNQSWYSHKLDDGTWCKGK